VCCCVLQCVTVCCSVLQRVAVALRITRRMAAEPDCISVLQCVTTCCSLSQCVAACCSMLPCVLQCVAVTRRVTLEGNTKHHTTTHYTPRVMRRIAAVPRKEGCSMRAKSEISSVHSGVADLIISITGIERRR